MPKKLNNVYRPSRISSARHRLRKGWEDALDSMDPATINRRTRRLLARKMDNNDANAASNAQVVARANRPANADNKKPDKCYYCGRFPLMPKLIVIKWLGDLFNTTTKSPADYEQEKALVSELLTQQLIGFSILTFFLLNGCVLLYNAFHCSVNGKEDTLVTATDRWCTSLRASMMSAVAAAAFLLPAILRVVGASEVISFWLTIASLTFLTVLELLDTWTIYTTARLNRTKSSLGFTTQGHLDESSYIALTKSLKQDTIVEARAFPLAFMMSMITATLSFKTVECVVEDPELLLPKLVGLVTLPVVHNLLANVSAVFSGVKEGKAMEVVEHWTRMARRELLVLTVWGMLVAKWNGVVYVPEVGLGLSVLLVLMMGLAGVVMVGRLPSHVVGAVLVGQFVVVQACAWL